MQGINPIRPPEPGDGSTLQVVNIFSTLQGEGPYAGHPALFIRLGGCNLACGFCDTEFEDFVPMALEAIVARAKAAAERLAVITGGEPLRQNIAPLCAALIAQGFTVQIETNGTLMRELPEEVRIVCSPKHTPQGYMPVRDDLLSRAQAIKFIVSHSYPGYNDVAEIGQSRYNIPVYVQPMDEGDARKNAANMKHAAILAQARGLRLSLQLHKIVGIP